MADLFDLLAHYERGREQPSGVISSAPFTVEVAEGIDSVKALEYLRSDIKAIPALPGEPDSWELVPHNEN